MGFRVKDIDIRNIDSSTISSLKHLISKHGVIVIENVYNSSISSDDLLSFAAKFGDPIKLPNGFGFNSSNELETESYITNITNIDPITGMVKTVNTAEYLHNDGDFWQNNYIYTFLYGDVIPTIGGNTHFIDLHLAHNHIKQQHAADIFDVIHGQSVVIDVNHIPDFQGSPFLDEFNAKYDVARHKMINLHPVTKQYVLYYACKFAEIYGFTSEESEGILSEIDDILMNNEWMSYKHEWNENDLIIWDNTRVMHRSMGGYYESARKLWRVQSRISLNNMNVL